MIALIKGYAGQAFVVNETDYLNDFYNDEEDSKAKDAALVNYSRSVDYGMRFLTENDIDFNKLSARPGECCQSRFKNRNFSIRPF